MILRLGNAQFPESILSRREARASRMRFFAYASAINMRSVATKLSDVLIIEPQLFDDPRGFFMETWHARKFADAGIDVQFVQDNHSGSQPWVLRGLHYQVRRPQGKLV